MQKKHYLAVYTLSGLIFIIATVLGFLITFTLSGDESNLFRYGMPFVVGLVMSLPFLIILPFAVKFLLWLIDYKSGKK